VRRLVIFLATGFYTGYLPLAPGTFGSLLGIPVLFLLSKTSAGSGWWAAAFLLVFSAPACWLAGRAERILDQPDSSKIVIDEVAGMVAAGLMIPLSWKSITVCFILFRLFDIAKPPPVGWLDRKLKGGIGVVADDLAAGVYANLLARLLLWLALRS